MSRLQGPAGIKNLERKIDETHGLLSDQGLLNANVPSQLLNFACMKMIL
jgi:hypothetical protein